MAQIHGSLLVDLGLLVDSLADTLIKLAVIGKDVSALANVIVEKVDSNT